jgi:hypothetical protein
MKHASSERPPIPRFIAFAARTMKWFFLVILFLAYPAFVMIESQRGPSQIWMMIALHLYFLVGIAITIIGHYLRTGIWHDIRIPAITSMVWGMIHIVLGFALGIQTWLEHLPTMFFYLLLNSFVALAGVLLFAAGIVLLANRQPYREWLTSLDVHDAGKSRV